MADNYRFAGPVCECCYLDRRTRATDHLRPRKDDLAAGEAGSIISTTGRGPGMNPAPFMDNHCQGYASMIATISIDLGSKITICSPAMSSQRRRCVNRTPNWHRWWLLPSGPVFHSR
jgi:hypothetical protein